MKDVTAFIIENTIDFKSIMSNLPIPVIKDWVVRYKASGTNEEFEKWVDDNAWMIVDSSYTKIKNYSIFLQDKNNELSYLGNKDIIGEEVNSDFVLNYFKPLYKQIFFNEDGTYNEKNLNDWAKSYNSLGRRDFYGNLIEKRELLDEPDFSEILLGLFIQSLGVTVQNYFDLTDSMPPTLEDAEFMILGFVDCSDPKVSLKEKWGYLEGHGKYLSADIYKRALYRMLKTNLSEQRRTVQQLCGMKSKKLRLRTIQELLNDNNQHLFCECWQLVTGV